MYEADWPDRQQIVKHEDYVALSYVWGRNTPYCTLLSNILQHCEPGGLEIFRNRLPKVIQDAILLVQRLGYRYLWIDSLCMLQDSPRSWRLNSQNMDLIFGNAALTICAADGNDSSTGLNALDVSSRVVRQPQAVCAGVHLMVSRPPETSIKTSTWNTRAWTLQERLLSRRCLIFVNSRVYFQCRATTMSEDIFVDHKGTGWSLDLIEAPSKMFDLLEHRAIWVYIQCVSLYTSRALTESEDVLAAFNGILNRIESIVQAPCIIGLPTSHFDFALLWEPSPE